MQLIHKLKTNKIIDKKKIEGYDMDQPFKITCIHMNNTYLAVAGAGGHVTLYKYYSKVNTGDELADLPVWKFYLLFNMYISIFLNQLKTY